MASNSQVAHIWAQQRKEDGRGSSFYFSGRTIYSFGPHYPIATFTDATIDGRRVVLFQIENNWGGYTGRHRQHTRSALSGLSVVVLDVAHVDTGHHAENVADYGERFAALLDKASRARTRGESYISRAEDIRATCRSYCAAFSLAVPDFCAEDISADADFLAGIRQRAAAARKQQEDSERARLAAKLAEWRTGAHVDVSRYPETVLRLSANGCAVETSRGASVPVNAARRLWQMVANCQHAGQALETPPPVSVGSFELERIAANGDVKVGCHFIRFVDSHAFAVAQGWTV